MPCYNTLAADRHADEQGRQFALDVAAEHLAQELLDTFDDGENTEFLNFEDVMDEVASDARFYQLIEHAWKSGEYQQLGDEIRRALRETAEQQLRHQKYDLIDHLEHLPEDSDG